MHDDIKISFKFFDSNIYTIMSRLIQLNKKKKHHG